MKSSEIRSSFLQFFQRNGHEIVRSSPLVPQNDPTLLFTNAGMVQFKDVFTGREQRSYTRATSSQKCLRAGGKHNDLENVGQTARHHTFFEMLGNFSFGDYFKEEAILLAWQWITRELGIDSKRLIVTVFGGDAGLKLPPDDEARTLWKKITGLPDERILGLGMADNFWMMGDTGPQGPCSELHYFVGDGPVDLTSFGQEPASDGTGWMEIWNLVFMQFNRAQKGGPLEPLPKPSIDTGAGLERLSAVLQNVRSNYDTDLLQPLVAAAAELARKPYTASHNADDMSMRVLADHARATSFLMADGVLPTNEGRGYVLRRIMRRAIRRGVQLGLEQGALATMCKKVIGEMRAAYPELGEAESLIVRATDAEDETFRRTLDRGLKLLEGEFAGEKSRTIAGEVVFKLYDTFGFPVDLTRILAEERGFTVDEAGFETRMAEQRGRSENFAGSGEKQVADIYKVLAQKFSASQFTGYDELQTDASVLALFDERGAELSQATSGQKVQLLLDRTPFYGESGGQVGDRGVIKGAGLEVEITDTQKPGGDLYVHHAEIKTGTLAVGQKITAVVDGDHRRAVRANHSATHLLHLALKERLGGHVAQKGSLVAADRLRFDFSHFEPLTTEERSDIEQWVNREILANQPTSATVQSFDEAKQSGAVALFGEKYGDVVRVMRIGSRSVELCGGTHVERTGDIGFFKILQETGIAQGVRRIEAVTGVPALDYVQRIENELLSASSKTRSPLFQVGQSVDRLQKELKDREKRIEELQRKLASGGKDLMSDVRQVAGVNVIVSRTEVADGKALREVADGLRQKLKSGVVVLGGVDPNDQKIALVAAVTADLTDRIHAGKIISALAAQIGGKGGGRADFAQGGGIDLNQLDEALSSVDKFLTNQ